MDRLVPLQRAGHDRPRGRGRRRRRHAAARQDRHDHLRQPAGRRTSSRCRASTDRAGRRGPARHPRRRDAGGPLVVVLAKEKHGLRGRDMAPMQADFVPFTAQTRMSGVDWTAARSARAPSIHHRVRRAARPAGAAAGYHRGQVDRRPHRQAAARRWRWSKDDRLLGVIHLKDIVKGGIRERFAELRAHGHPHRHDHRRQPADRGGHRRRGRRRRLPGRGDAGGQARS